MNYYRKLVGERLYLSPFDTDDIEICTKWAEWMNDKTVGDNYGGLTNLVTLSSAKKTLQELRGYRFGIVLLDGDVLIGHILSVHADNYAAINCYKKVGFRESGRRREWIFKDGKYIDKLYMDILASELKNYMG